MRTLKLFLCILIMMHGQDPSRTSPETKFNASPSQLIDNASQHFHCIDPNLSDNCGAKTCKLFLWFTDPKRDEMQSSLDSFIRLSLIAKIKQAIAWHPEAAAVAPEQ
jgi:hypothetical protein